MTRRVLVTGHWNDGSPQQPSSRAALEALAAGFTAQSPHWEAEARPLGPGPAFAESFQAIADHSWAPISVPVWAESTRAAGEEVLVALDAGLTPVVEGGHNIDVDAGLGFLSALSGIDVRADDRDLERTLGRALAAAAERIDGRAVVAASSTTRPLLGLASVLAIGVDLGPRDHQNISLTAALTAALALPTAVRGLPLLAGRDRGQNHPGRLAGSGAAGGAAAVIAALGGRIIPTGDFLVHQTSLDRALDDCDLVVVAEPRLHSPKLAEATLDAVTAAAADRALPVVAVGVESTLSNHEKAQWGVHGVFTTDGATGLDEAGRRLARTWGRI